MLARQGQLTALLAGDGEQSTGGPKVEAVDLTEEVKGVAEEVNGDLKLEMCQLKLEMCEMKVQLHEMMVKIMEAKEEIKEEIAKGNKSPPVFTCQISQVQVSALSVQLALSWFGHVMLVAVI